MSLRAYAERLVREFEDALELSPEDHARVVASDAILTRAALDLLRLGRAATDEDLADPQLRAAWLAASRDLDEERAQRVAGLLTGERLTAAGAHVLMVRP